MKKKYDRALLIYKLKDRHDKPVEQIIHLQKTSNKLDTERGSNNIKRLRFQIIAVHYFYPYFKPLFLQRSKR